MESSRLEFATVPLLVRARYDKRFSSAVFNPLGERDCKLGAQSPHTSPTALDASCSQFFRGARLWRKGAEIGFTIRDKTGFRRIAQTSKSARNCANSGLLPKRQYSYYKDLQTVWRSGEDSSLQLLLAKG